MSEHEIKVTYRISTKKDAITEGSMKRVLKTLLSIDDKEDRYYYITDATGKEYCFSISFSDCGYDVYLSCEQTEDETTSGEDVATTYGIFYENGRLDYDFADYDVNRY